MNNTPPSSAVTQLLIEWCNGDKTTLDAFDPVSRKSRSSAHHYMHRRILATPSHMTALVNEAFVRLMDQTRFR